MRETGVILDEAVNWFTTRKIPLWQVNNNPEQNSWTNSRKIFAHFYIDDAAVGCPLIYNPLLSTRPFVDWKKISQYFENLSINHWHDKIDLGRIK
jgi:hypothetical protein